MKILLTGAKGQLGQSISNIAPSDWDILFADKNKLDISNENDVNKIVGEFSPDIIINAAAFTSVDKAEVDADNANLVNHQGAKFVADAAQKYNARLIHISTDYVFDGTKSTPYAVDDECKPINVYGSSKRNGEVEVLSSCDNAIILRTSWVYSENGANFLKTIFALLNSGKSITVVDDQIGCPTYAPDLAAMIINICQDSRISGGIYHYCGDTTISWCQFAKLIAEKSGIDSGLIQEVLSENYNSPAQRPAYSVLNCSNLEQLGYQRSNFSNGLHNSLEKLVIKS
ncbi:dTDP-4-dehydrorhamnose reductase [Cedecea davisae]|uniref:dTDP-4-dehydrorhamnose reductase n=1 Tax=Cedecea davisae TaxID=158484 RepID=A0ABS6DID9_9ENTR|nr:dTDP-4-dehydrorhamnose reductase [Cedecea davisae]MBU4682989.1 dTDP-4-dehydrorhamnose reductase [Cedecea davisae]MBU4687912.1 dTDP-4-dehydrorhamnose reductase [Cedecea davisae]